MKLNIFFIFFSMLCLSLLSARENGYAPPKKEKKIVIKIFLPYPISTIKITLLKVPKAYTEHVSM